VSGYGGGVGFQMLNDQQTQSLFGVGKDESKFHSLFREQLRDRTLSVENGSIQYGDIQCTRYMRRAHACTGACAWSVNGRNANVA
jgi:hypothetical protein